MEFITKEVIKTMKFLQSRSDSLQLVKPPMDMIKKGLIVSARACKQPKDVVMTPWMKNLYEAMDRHDGTHVTVEGAPKLKSVQFLSKVVEAALLKFNGPKTLEYNETLDVTDPQHYNVDCWIQNKFDSNWWDAQPGQEKQIAETLKEYTKPTNLTTDKFIKLLSQEKELQLATEWIFKRHPDYTKFKDFMQGSIPFVGRDSNVGALWFYNDKTIKEGSTITWGKYVFEFTKKLSQNGTKPWAVWEYNIYTAFPRFQRGKGRALEAQSRVMVIVINQIEAPEIEVLKSLPEFTGLNDDQTQKENMIKMAEWLKQHPKYTCGNWDQEAYDKHIGQGLNCWNQSIRYLRCKGNSSKEIAVLRYCQTDKGWLVDGPNKRLSIIRGRQESGQSDTMAGNTHISWAVDVASNLKLDPNYSKEVLYSCPVPGMYLGDDVMSVHLKHKDAKENYSDYCKTLGLVVKPEKYAFGLFFLQYRLIEKEGKYIMAYPWVRVFRSLLSKENAKGLGPAGWVLAGEMSLAHLIEYPEMLSIVVSLIVPLDRNGFYLDKTASYLLEQVKIEDQQAQIKKGRRFKKTSDILFDGNPLNSKWFTDNVDISSEYVHKVHESIKAAYVPNFYESLGFKTPKIVKA